MRGKLLLEDGSIFYGQLLNDCMTAGEVVFNTGMTGYQEVLTDPSYCGQIVTMTYPLIGNYGVAELFKQSRKPYVKGFIIGELCERPNSWMAENTLIDFLNKHGIPCLYGVDTRAVTRRIRAQGAMKGTILPADAESIGAERVIEQLNLSDVVSQVTTTEVYRRPNSGEKVVVMDFGIKENILNSLSKKGFDLTIVPADTSAEDIIRLNPDGIFLSNGPGDPKDLPQVVENVKKLVSLKPVFGICLGHQLLTLAMGGDTYKLKFGHRGSNQPVQDLTTGRVYITSQNHGYAVNENSLMGLDVVVTHRAVNDGTVEGIKHKNLPVFSVQYHPEAAPGPDDNVYLFEEFKGLMTKGE